MSSHFTGSLNRCPRCFLLVCFALLCLALAFNFSSLFSSISRKWSYGKKEATIFCFYCQTLTKFHFSLFLISNVLKIITFDLTIPQNMEFSHLNLSTWTLISICMRPDRWKIMLGDTKVKGWKIRVQNHKKSGDFMP